MAVMKKKDIDWRYYLRELVQSKTKISDFERTEFAGFLLERDTKGEMNMVRYNLFSDLVTQNDCVLVDIISQFLTAESPENKDNLISSIKTIVVNYYNDEINRLIEEETNSQEIDGA